jgi:hypothetical protein
MVAPIRTELKMMQEEYLKISKDEKLKKSLEVAMQETEKRVRDKMKAKAEAKATEIARQLMREEPKEDLKIIKRVKNPPKDPNRKNIPAKPPAFVRSPAGCQISNHLAVKKWMEKYGNK